MNETILLFTHGYPYGKSEFFLEGELNALSKAFKKITLIPYATDEQSRKLPENVDVDLSYAYQLPKTPLKQAWAALCSSFFYQEIFKNPHVLYKPLHLKRLLGYAYRVKTCVDWLQTLLKKTPSFQNCLFYTYWWDEQAVALSFVKKHYYPKLKTISRAHCYEIYEQKSRPPYIPFRELTINSINRLFPVSNDGRRHIVQLFNENEGKITVSRLGVKDPGFLAKSSKPGDLAIASCSFLIPHKRVELIIESLSVFAKWHPEMTIHWDHLGGGPEEKRLRELAKNLPNNVRWSFHGPVSNARVYEFYNSHPVDLFLLLSESEGIPVSIMEALSCGIAVIATDCGGTREIVDPCCGMLLPESPKAVEVARAIEYLTQNPEKLEALKNGARKQWENHYTEKNYQEFCKSLYEVIHS